MIARAEQVWPAIRDSPEYEELTALLREDGAGGASPAIDP